MKNTNACEHCGHKQSPDGGWCYMFRVEPTGPCAQHTIGAAAAMARRLQVAQRTLDSMKSKDRIDAILDEMARPACKVNVPRHWLQPNTEAKGPRSGPV